MNRKLSLSVHVHGFFTDYLRTRRNVSPQTILAYRDALKLLLSFAAQRSKKKVSALTFENIHASAVLAFLDHLEKDRGNSIQTRNLRLAAIHSFIQHVAGSDPERMTQCQQILAIPKKRGPRPEVVYLEADEVKAFLDAADRSGPLAARDKAIVAFLFNTGARVSELVDLNIGDVRWQKPFDVRVVGKGRKERYCPLWSETIDLMRAYLRGRKSTDDDEPLFLNRRDERLTRFGIRETVNRLHTHAAEKHPTLKKKRVGPHTFRHTAAVHLLRSNVDVNVIKAWLGHTSIETTSRYIALDLAAKRAALEKCDPIQDESANTKQWRKNDDLLEWLKQL